MKTFVVHVSDAHGIDERAIVDVPDAMDLGRAAQIALDEVIEKHGRKLTFPVFIDIQLKADFADRAWMHAPPTVASAPAPTPVRIN